MKQLHYKVLVALAIIIGGISITGGILMAARPEPPFEGYEIVWLGDTLLADASDPVLIEQGYEWPFGQLGHVADSADLVVMNLEGPITARSEQWHEHQRWHYNAQPAAAKAIAGLGVSVVSLANNHALDRGPLGLADTIDALDEFGVTAIGAGADAESAAKPYILNTQYGSVGVFTFGKNSSTAPDAGVQAGIRSLSTSNIDSATQIAESAKVDWLVAFVHWGSNYTDVSSSQRRFARYLVESGFDLVVGTGPHNVQRIDVIQGTFVAYSIGNFAFGTPGRWTELHPGYGLILTTVLGPKGFRDIKVECIETDNKVVNFQPRPCDGTSASALLAKMHPQIVVSGPIGELSR